MASIANADEQNSRPREYAREMNRLEKPELVVLEDATNVGDHLRGAVLAIGNLDGFHLGHQQL